MPHGRSSPQICPSTKLVVVSLLSRPSALNHAGDVIKSLRAAGFEEGVDFTTFVADKHLRRGQLHHGTATPGSSAPTAVPGGVGGAAILERLPTILHAIKHLSGRPGVAAVSTLGGLLSGLWLGWRWIRCPVWSVQHGWLSCRWRF